MVALFEWERLLTDEKEFLSVDITEWEKLMGWPRTREQAELYTARLHKQLQLSAKHPPRRSKMPPLLTRAEVDELRKYPGGMMTFVLITWALQAAKATGDLPGGWFNAMYASCAKLRQSAYRIRLQLAMPVPLPYFHSLMLPQNINCASELITPSYPSAGANLLSHTQK